MRSGTTIEKLEQAEQVNTREQEDNGASTLHLAQATEARFVHKKKESQTEDRAQRHDTLRELCDAGERRGEQMKGTEETIRVLVKLRTELTTAVNTQDSCVEGADKQAHEQKTLTVRTLENDLASVKEAEIAGQEERERQKEWEETLEREKAMQRTEKDEMMANSPRRVVFHNKIGHLQHVGSQQPEGVGRPPAVSHGACQSSYRLPYSDGAGAPPSRP